MKAAYYKKVDKSTIAAIIIVVLSVVIAGIAIMQLSRGKVLTLNGYDTPNPKEVKVKAGEKVFLNVETRTPNEEWDIYIPTLDQHGTLSKYSPTVLEFTADKPGAHDIVVKQEDGPRKTVSKLVVED